MDTFYVQAYLDLAIWNRYRTVHWWEHDWWNYTGKVLDAYRQGVMLLTWIRLAARGINICVFFLKGDFPWDEKDFRYMAIAVAGISSTFLYFYFRDTGKEISWKEFVHFYLARGLVRAGLEYSLINTVLIFRQYIKMDCFNVCDFFEQMFFINI